MQCNGESLARQRWSEEKDGTREKKKTRGCGMDDGQLGGDAGSIIIRLACGSGVIPA